MSEGGPEPATELVSGILSGVVLNPTLSTPYTCLDEPSESLPRIMDRIYEERRTRSGIATESIAHHMRSTKVDMLESLVRATQEEETEAADALAAETAEALSARLFQAQLQDTGSKWRREVPTDRTQDRVLRSRLLQAIAQRFQGREKLITNHVVLSVGSRRMRQVVAAVEQLRCKRGVVQGGWTVFVHGLDSISTSIIDSVQFTVRAFILLSAPCSSSPPATATVVEALNRRMQVASRRAGSQVHTVCKVPFETTLVRASLSVASVHSPPLRVSGPRRDAALVHLASDLQTRSVHATCKYAVGQYMALLSMRSPSIVFCSGCTTHVLKAL